MLSKSSWPTAATYPDRLTAQAALERLTAAGFPCYIASDEFVPGLGQRYTIKVPAAQRQHAATALGDVQATDQELVDLALSQPRED